MSNTMTSEEARAAWEELVAIERAHPVLAGIAPMTKVPDVSIDAPRKRSVRSGAVVSPDPVLAAIVGSQPLPRTDVTKKLWAYIKRNRLQDRVKRTIVHADAKLRPLFGGKEEVSMFEMTNLVSAHLKPTDTRFRSGGSRAAVAR